MADKQLYAFSKEAFDLELDNIFGWWAQHMPDPTGNGFFGRVDGLGKVDFDADKGVILNTRILWACSAACRLGKTQFQLLADKAYQYLLKHFVDPDFGGLYWSVNAQGAVVDAKKQVYAQAFGIYAFSEYYLLTGDKQALDLARSLFELLEAKAKDKKNFGYWEAKSQSWEPLEVVALSEKEGNDAKTMNTHLHVLEAYTNLYRCDQSKPIAKALSKLICLYVDKFVDLESKRLKLFFDEFWVENYTHESFGHEIESAWLLNEACEVLGDKVLQAQVNFVTIEIAYRVKAHGIDHKGAVYNDRFQDGTYHAERDWWPQAEGVVGFFDAYQSSMDEELLETSSEIWNYIQLFQKDYENGEWYWGCDEDGNPIVNKDKAGPWKAPYHNGRMCIEMIKRLSNN